MSKELQEIYDKINTLEEKINRLENELNLVSNSALLLDKHPIVAISDYSDVAEFDLGTGWADNEGKWNGWALCNGNTYANPVDNTANDVISPDLTDRVLVGADSATVGDVTGVFATTGSSGKQLTKVVYVIKVYDAKSY